MAHLTSSSNPSSIPASPNLLSSSSLSTLVSSLVAPSTFLFAQPATSTTSSTSAATYSNPPHTQPPQQALETPRPTRATFIQKVDMDKPQQPSSFQQLEKLGEGTYAT
ncbi:hypothetical protein F66182_17171, partial [Fusarium sp. NRRL 66182]